MDRDPNNLQPWLAAAASGVTVLAVTSVCLRLLSRYEKRQPLWWDDWFIIASMAWNLLVVAFGFTMLFLGMGKHSDTIPARNIVLLAKLLVVAEILYVFNLAFTKISLLLMFYRVFHFPSFKRWVYAIGTFVILWVICITLLFIFPCVPVHKLWHPDIPGHCINQIATWIANAASTLVSDLAILILPMHQVWRLQLQRAQKIALSFMFGLGFFVIFASAFRLSVLCRYDPNDSSYTITPTVGWTAIEMSAGIVSACLPTLGPAFAFLARRLGLSGRLGTFLRSGNSANIGVSSNADRKTHTSEAREQATESNRISRREDYGGRFYRLTEGIGEGETNGAADIKLRPDEDAGCYVTTTTTGQGESSSVISGDEIPLHSIRVHTAVKQVRS